MKKKINIKNWWKKKPYWLKGGVIGLLLSVVIGNFAVTGMLGRGLMQFYFVFPNKIMDAITKCSGYNCVENMYLIHFIWALLFGFLIGSLLGIILSKINKIKK